MRMLSTYETQWNLLKPLLEMWYPDFVWLLYSMSWVITKMFRTVSAWKAKEHELLKFNAWRGEMSHRPVGQDSLLSCIQDLYVTTYTARFEVVISTDENFRMRIIITGISLWNILVVSRKLKNMKRPRFCFLKIWFVYFNHNYNFFLIIFCITQYRV